MRLFGAEPKPKPKRRIWLRALVLMLAAALFSAGFILLRAMPRLEKIICAYVRTIASGEIDEAVLNYMETNGITYGNMIELHFDSAGAVTSVTADSAKIDALIARLDDEIGVELEEKVITATVPLGVVLGSEMFGGGGPELKVSFFPINVVNIHARHEFTAQGINQTLHTVWLDISAEIEVLFPLGSKIETVGTEILLGQTLIVGGVPNAYVERQYSKNQQK